MVTCILIAKFITILALTSLKLVISLESFNILKYGADLEGVNKSTDAINEAINEASKIGGGIIYFPSGEYLTGAIHLKSNITLQLQHNATIKFSTDFDDYLPMVRMRWEGTELINFSPLIYANGVENIAVTGNGVLDGQGKHWWDYRKMLYDQYMKTGALDSKWQKEFYRVNNLTEVLKTLDDPSRIMLGFLRPPLFQPINSRNVLLSGITIRDSPFWNVNPVFCENVTVTGVTILAPPTAGNTDGVDPDSCKDVLIHNTTFDLGDDCIAIKSGRDLQGRTISRPTENVLITDCTMLRGVSGVAIGSEQSGGVRNVTVSNCVFNGTRRGIYLKSTQGRGGVVENIHVRDILMRNMEKEGVLMTLYYTSAKQEPFSQRTPVFRNIDISNITGNANISVVLLGLPESPIENVSLTNISVMALNGGLIANNTRNLQLKNFNHNSNTTKLIA